MGRPLVLLVGKEITRPFLKVFRKSRAQCAFPVSFRIWVAQLQANTLYLLHFGHGSREEGDQKLCEPKTDTNRGVVGIFYNVAHLSILKCKSRRAVCNRFEKGVLSMLLYLVKTQGHNFGESWLQHSVQMFQYKPHVVKFKGIGRVARVGGGGGMTPWRGDITPSFDFSIGEMTSIFPCK